MDEEEIEQIVKASHWFRPLHKALSLEDDSVMNSKDLNDTRRNSNEESYELHDPVQVDAVMLAAPKVEESSDESNSDDQECQNIIEPEELQDENLTYNVKALLKNATTYKLENFKKNYLMIFNQENIAGYNPRKGTEKDVQALQNTFSRYGFETFVHKDPTKDQILEELKIFSNKDFTEYGCVAVAVLTHGTRHGLLRAKDQQYNESEIINSFKTYNKPTLITKPKLLIIQACRGYKLIPGVLAHGGGQIRRDIDESVETYTLPVEADMLVLHSSYMGCPSHRDELHGSWFIQSLCRKIIQFAAKLDLESIITEMKREVAIDQSHLEYNRRTGEIDTNKQMPVTTSTLIRKLYLRTACADQAASTSTDEASMEHTQTDNEPSTPTVVQSGPCTCFLSHFSYIRNCLRYFVDKNPDDRTAQSYLNISNAFDDGVEFNTSKEQMAKAICEHLCMFAKDFEFFKYLYLYNYNIN